MIFTEQERSRLRSLTESFHDTIRKQIGHKALYMIGAKNFSYSDKDKYLGFRIGRNAKSINWIRVRVAPGDTYTMEFGRGVSNPRVVATEKNVYADQLRAMIEKHTGMATSL